MTTFLPGLIASLSLDWSGVSFLEFSAEELAAFGIIPTEAGHPILSRHEVCVQLAGLGL